MRLQSVVHANRRLKEVPYRDHAVSLEEQMRHFRALRSSSPPCAWQSVWSSRVGCRGVILRDTEREGVT